MIVPLCDRVKFKDNETSLEARAFGHFEAVMSVVGKEVYGFVRFKQDCMFSPYSPAFPIVCSTDEVDAVISNAYIRYCNMLDESVSAFTIKSFGKFEPDYYNPFEEKHQGHFTDKGDEDEEV